MRNETKRNIVGIVVGGTLIGTAAGVAKYAIDKREERFVEAPSMSIPIDRVNDWVSQGYLNIPARPQLPPGLTSEDLQQDMITTQYERENPPIVITGPDGTMVETETTTEEELLFEHSFFNALKNWRIANGLKPHEREEVLDEASEIQGKYLSEMGIPLTHTTEHSWLVNNYPQPVEISGVQPVERSRARGQIASVIVQLNDGQEEGNIVYYANGGNGVFEELVGGAQTAEQALVALLNSEYHLPGLSLDVPTPKIGIRKFGNILVLVFAEGDPNHEWAPSERQQQALDIMTEKLDKKIYLPLIDKDARDSKTIAGGAGFKTGGQKRMHQRNRVNTRYKVANSKGRNNFRR